jgi:hypothetical protein
MNPRKLVTIWNKYVLCSQRVCTRPLLIKLFRIKICFQAKLSSYQLSDNTFRHIWKQTHAKTLNSVKKSFMHHYDQQENTILYYGQNMKESWPK